MIDYDSQTAAQDDIAGWIIVLTIVAFLAWVLFA